MSKPDKEATMSAETVTVRIKFAKAKTMSGIMLRQMLADHGIDVTAMACVEEGDELVYSSERVTKGHAVTKDNPRGMNASGSAGNGPAVREGIAGRVAERPADNRASAASSGGNGEVPK